MSYNITGVQVLVLGILVALAIRHPGEQSRGEDRK